MNIDQPRSLVYITYSTVFGTFIFFSFKSHDVGIMASCPLVVTPARASSQVEHGWRSHLVSEVTLTWQGAVTVKLMS